MPTYNVYIELVDAYNRSSVKRYKTISTMLDHPTAVTAAAALAADLAALTEMDVLAHSVALRTVYTDTVTAGANKDEGITLSVRKANNFRDILRVPAPLNAVLNPDGTVDITSALVTDYYDNFVSGSGDFTLSDGEQAIALLAGKLDK
jgi:hypothetical protein